MITANCQLHYYFFFVVIFRQYYHQKSCSLTTITSRVFLQELGCQKPCWDQARLSSLVNKQVVQVEEYNEVQEQV